MHPTIESWDLGVKRSDFPSDFAFFCCADRRISRRSWKRAKYLGQVCPPNPQRIQDHSNMFTAIDLYKRYREDVKALNDLGMDGTVNFLTDVRCVVTHA